MSAWANEKRPGTLADSIRTEAATACSSSPSSSSSESSFTWSEDVHLEVAPDHGRDRERLLCPLPEPVDPPAEHLVHALRKAELGECTADRPASAVLLIERARLGQVAQQLAGVERVSVGL